MAEPFVAELSRGDIGEIPAYVVRPVQSFESRYPTASIFHAPVRDLRDFDRPNFRQRMAVMLGRPAAVSIQRIVPVADRSGTGEAISSLHYEAIIAPVRRKAVWPAIAAALVVAAFPLGWAVTRHHDAERAVAVQTVPAAHVVAAATAPAAPAVERPIAKPVAVAPAVPAKRTHDETYHVVSGDSFSSVGVKFGLTPRTVRLASGLPLGAHLKLGQVLVLPAENGACHRVKAGETLGVLAQRYGVSEASLRSHNPGVRPAHLKLGQRIFVAGATHLLDAEERTSAGRGYRRGYMAKGMKQRLEASRSLIGQFGNRVGGLLWPAHGQFSSPFGVRGAHFHPGVDISNAVGTPIHAAKAGQVISAGWSSGYGYAIDIDHGGGVVTRYGHCSKLLVAAGQHVAQGESIGLMGSTGHSTGPHVHFEVRIGGRAVNPASFF